MASEHDEELPPPPVPAPDEAPERVSGSAAMLIIACGALAREILALIDLNGWRHMDLTCLPADLHNRPKLIPERLRAKIRANRDRYDRILVAYADCGTGGDIDKVLAEEGGERLAGPHCYAFFAGQEAFDALHEAEPGTFYLTDYLARHFETLVIKGMKLDRHPELLAMMFGNYKRLVYLAQTDDPALDARAEAGAARLGLAYERRRTGYGELADFMAEAASGHATVPSAQAGKG
ncbi:DUF1638 domain-containing protein [Marivibrio halodurans]|uniref:DUF1638 domain-containing protein n=1 Tax=Marivibrio halodurans TaxID=2039722 RepID=A0A8J7SPV9_9PROT|nr:DUF1638 domain-containing protein [Marivibrio halodurans]MBP5858873.1 DUF1638 domain-containing protein [Marivibrio halodurans]